ncbi:MAG: immunoglobulin domain-containing protein [Verrucomicrobiae bacterium]|nr:immunoglobulin domain-containing protein [Verrucomicrobiae bacterium]
MLTPRALRSFLPWKGLFLLCSLAAYADLGSALNPALPWSTSPDRPWVEVFDITHDDESAARSAFLSAGQSSWLRTTVTGPGRIEFWWKVSTDYELGYLRFSVLGQTLEINGEYEWELVSIPLPAGQHVLEWTYAKLPGFSMMGDAAWLDEVTFTPGDNPPRVIRDPANVDILAGDELILNPFVSGSLPLAYQWYFNGSPLAGATQAVLRIPGVFTNQAGAYRLVVRNPFGVVTSATARVTVTLDPLAVALNAPHLLWETTPFAPWEPQSVTTHDGVAAAQSPPLFDNEASAISTTVTGPGFISFWWKVSSDGDALSFTINNVEQDFIYAEVDWEKRTFPVPPGRAVLEWVYVKDSAGSAGDDAGYLDEVTFLPAPRLQSPRLQAGQFSLQVNTLPGFHYTLEYQNTLRGTNWTPLLTVPGDGTLKTISDSAPPSSQRFYRLRQTLP